MAEESGMKASGFMDPAESRAGAGWVGVRPGRSVSDE